MKASKKYGLTILQEKIFSLMKMNIDDINETKCLKPWNIQGFFYRIK
jgi:hypothetical protein